MSEFSSFATREMASERISDQIAVRRMSESPRMPGRRRGAGRHRVARGLHRIADRLDI